jgi:multicomponent Na+:H+ antiporter subunit E
MERQHDGQGGTIVTVMDDVSVEFRRGSRIPLRAPSRRNLALSLLLRAIPLYAMWLALSGFFDAFHMTVGAVCCLAVAAFSRTILPPRPASPFPLRPLLLMPGYCLWLLWEIAKANAWVLYLVFHPRMMDKIDPRLFTFKSRLRSRAALTVFANSITLTPGTITVSVNDRGDFLVHAIDGKSAAGLPGEMEEKIAATFGE